MSNRITIYGHLGKDAEIKDVNGQRIMVLNIACNHKIKGEEIVIWRSVTFWDDIYRKMEPYLKKGSSLRIYGEELPPTIYKDKVQLAMTGKDIMFNSTGKKSDKKDSDFVAEPAQEESRLPGLPPC